MKVFIIILFVLLVGVGGFYVGQNYKLVPTTKDTPALITQMPTPTQEPQMVTTVAPTIDETATLIAAMKVAIVAKRGADAASLTYTVSKIEGNYAQGAASSGAGGGMWFAAKVNGTWNLVWDGNGTILCSDLTNYPNFPTDMIPECYDMATQKNIVR